MNRAWRQVRGVGVNKNGDKSDAVNVVPTPIFSGSIVKKVNKVRDSVMLLHTLIISSRSITSPFALTCSLLPARRSNTGLLSASGAGGRTPSSREHEGISENSFFSLCAR